MTCEIHSFGLGGISLIQRSIASGGYACDREQPTSGNGRTILFYLTTQRGHTQVSLRIWCRLQESNPRHLHYKWSALPAELHQHIIWILRDDGGGDSPIATPADFKLQTPYFSESTPAGTNPALSDPFKVYCHVSKTRCLSHQLFPFVGAPGRLRSDLTEIKSFVPLH